MRKGITPVLATIILLLIAVSLSLVAWVWLSGYLDSISGCIKILDVKDNIMFLQNCGQVNIPTFDAYVADVNVPVFEIDKTLPKDSTKKFSLTYIPAAGLQTLRIVSPYAIASQGFVFPKAWIIKAFFGQNCNPPGSNNNCKFLVLGDVYLNDGSGRKYTNKPINVNIDNGIVDQDVLTNASGGFNVTTTWNFTSLFPGSWWSVSRKYSHNFSSQIVDPPGRIDYTDAQFNVKNVLTQRPFISLDGFDELFAWKDITPFYFTKDFVVFSLNYTINTNTSIVPPTDEPLYGTVIDGSGITVQCFDSPDAQCISAGKVLANLSTSLAGRTFNLTNIRNGLVNFSVNATVFPPFGNLSLGRLKVQYFKLDPNTFDPFNAELLFTKWYDPINVLSPGVQSIWGVSLNLTELQQEYIRKYNTFPLDGPYMATLTITDPVNKQVTYGNLLLAGFWINDTTLLTDLTLTIETVPPTALYWYLPNIARNQSYSMGALVNVSRNPTTPKILRTTQELFALANYSYMVNRSMAAGAGGITLNTITDFSADISIPAQDTDFMAYALAIPRSIHDSIVDMEVKTYVANIYTTGTTHNYISVSVTTSRGDLKTCAQTLGIGGSISCSLSVTPGPNELVQNMIKIGAAGYNPTFQYAIEGLSSGPCTYPGDEKVGAGKPQCQYASCRGTECTFNRCASDTFCDETVAVNCPAGGCSSDASFDIINLQSPTDLVAPTIQLWNWYINTVPLWQNQGTHTSIFVTKDPSPFFPATVFYTFIT